MGQIFSDIWNTVFGSSPVQIVMIGLDGAGKTTTLYKLKLGEVIHTVPTIGFNVERVEHKNLTFQVWDLGGQDKIRKLWRHYLQNSDALVFVVDSSDRERLGMAKTELEKTLAFDELRDASLLVFANKQDLPKALSTQAIADGLGLSKLKRGGPGMSKGRQLRLEKA
eukprot:CAMPEP_0167777206 /NCGR_PEP_ID=MMETSP0111_2-20121227/3560_1 /TAXON_ID=91324 /ORGANISM="Lotharella globosa, Strain CCCM811" /LENGTH=166 /DNA_ID=CAMNT_0007667355 /DNA_START=60 /DNA_END=561 /DNA_ORIENTATION=-